MRCKVDEELRAINIVLLLMDDIRRVRKICIDAGLDVPLFIQRAMAIDAPEEMKRRREVWYYQI